MRIIHHNDDETELIAQIAGEMFNIESGKLWYERGIQVQDKDKHNYPEFCQDGVNISIRASYGILIVPKLEASHYLIQGVSQKLQEISSLYQKKTGTHHLQNYAALETGSNHFNVVRVKNVLERVTYDTPNDSKAQRIFCKITTNLSKRSSLVGGGRFTWFIYDMNNLIYSIENYSGPIIDPVAQLVTILYDKKKIFAYQANEIVCNQACWQNVKLTKNFHDILYLGNVSSELMAKLRVRGNELISSVSPLTSSDMGTSTTTSTITPPSPKAVMGRELLDLVEIYKHYRNRPEFVLSSYLSSTVLILCPVRRGAFEIIRHLGNWTIFQVSAFANIPLHHYRGTVYEDDFSNLVINNPKDGCCANCNTPLYEDIYVKYEYETSIEGTAYCPVCIHATFSHTTGRLGHDIRGQLLYTNTNTIIRSKYPRSSTELIEELPVDDIVKNILKASFGIIYHEQEEINSALYLGISLNSKTLPENYYIAWDGPVAKYVIDYAGEKQRKKRQMYSKFKDIFNGGILFSAKILSI